MADCPLVEAISQDVVKHPVLPDAPSRAKLVERQSAKCTEKYADYTPDYLVKVSDKEVFVVETKGREDLDVPLKMERLRQWCEDINRVQSGVRYDFVYVDQESFERYRPASFRQLVHGSREYK